MISLSIYKQKHLLGMGGLGDEEEHRKLTHRKIIIFNMF